MKLCLQTVIVTEILTASTPPV